MRPDPVTSRPVPTGGGAADGRAAGGSPALSHPAPTAALSGRLESIQLFDVCQFLLLNRRTGTLTVKSGDRTLRIYFVGGAIYDITDEAMRTGERLLLEGVQWTSGSFSLDPSPPGVAQRITESTEGILLEAARTIDECRSKESSDPPPHRQEEIFRERQSFAGDLAEAFRVAMDADAPARGAAASAAGDPLDALVRDVSAARGSLILRGRNGILRHAGPPHPYRSPLDAGEIPERLKFIPAGRNAARFIERRFERGNAWFHLRCRNTSGMTQVLLAHLRAEIPPIDTFGCDPATIALLDAGAPGGLSPGLYLWSGLPGGFRSTVLASWLAWTSAAEEPAESAGPTVWIEDDPRIAWEAIAGSFVYGGDSSRATAASIMEWNPQRVVIDPVRTPRAAKIACELAEAGIPTIAVLTGLLHTEAAERFQEALEKNAILVAGTRIRRALRGWVGILPLGDTGLVAVQVERIGVPKPLCSYHDEIERLARIGRITTDTATRLMSELHAVL
jgi:hypothetical protein